MEYTHRFHFAFPVARHENVACKKGRMVSTEPETFEWIDEYGNICGVVGDDGTKNNMGSYVTEVKPCS